MMYTRNQGLGRIAQLETRCSAPASKAVPARASKYVSSRPRFSLSSDESCVHFASNNSGCR
jgi:hypothetical protein